MLFSVRWIISYVFNAKDAKIIAKYVHSDIGWGDLLHAQSNVWGLPLTFEMPDIMDKDDHISFVRDWAMTEVLFKMKKDMDITRIEIAKDESIIDIFIDDWLFWNPFAVHKCTRNLQEISKPCTIDPSLVSAFQCASEAAICKHFVKTISSLVGRNSPEVRALHSKATVENERASDKLEHITLEFNQNTEAFSLNAQRPSKFTRPVVVQLSCSSKTISSLGFTQKSPNVYEIGTQLHGESIDSIEAQCFELSVKAALYDFFANKTEIRRTTETCTLLDVKDLETKLEEIGRFVEHEVAATRLQAVSVDNRVPTSLRTARFLCEQQLDTE